MNRLIRLQQALSQFGFAHTGIRKEDKFLLPFQASNFFTEYLFSLPSRFVERYPARRVNSIYFDTNDREMLRQSIDGDTFKLKTRFRWYGEKSASSPGVFELKLKDGDQGIKLKKENILFSDLESSCFENLNQVFPGLKHLRPVVFVSYLRSYYQSVCGQLVITLDNDLRASVVSLCGQSNPSVSLTDSIVCELKTEMSEFQKNFTSELNIPFRKTRLSKYDFSCRVLGI